MIHILSRTTKKQQKNTFQASTFKVKENSRTSQGFAKKFKDFSRKKWNSQTFQGLPLNFNDFSRLCEPYG